MKRRREYGASLESLNSKQRNGREDMKNEPSPLMKVMGASVIVVMLIVVLSIMLNGCKWGEFEHNVDVPDIKVDVPELEVRVYLCIDGWLWDFVKREEPIVDETTGAQRPCTPYSGESVVTEVIEIPTGETL